MPFPFTKPDACCCGATGSGSGSGSGGSGPCCGCGRTFDPLFVTFEDSDCPELDGPTYQLDASGDPCVFFKLAVPLTCTVGELAEEHPFDIEFTCEPPKLTVTPTTDQGCVMEADMTVDSCDPFQATGTSDAMSGCCGCSAWKATVTE